MNLDSKKGKSGKVVKKTCCYYFTFFGTFKLALYKIWLF